MFLRSKKILLEMELWNFISWQVTPTQRAKEQVPSFAMT
jgi:hypothetical protein